MTREQLLLVAPQILLSAAALAVLMLGAFARDKAAAGAAWLAQAGFVSAGLVSIRLWNSWTLAPHEPFGMMRADGMACFFNLLFAAAGLLSVMISSRFLAEDEVARRLAPEFCALILLATVGMMTMAGASDLLMVFLGLETLSIPLYILAGFARGRERSLEAAVKYLLLGAFASGFLLFGMALLFAAAATTDLGQLARFAAARPRAQGNTEVYLLYAGIALLMIGLMFKVALVPFHQWTPDVYEGSPTPVTAFMSVGSKAAGFAAAWRVLGSDEGFGLIDAHWDGLLWVIAAASFLVANVAALAQTSLKRMLGYSGIAHAGYVLIGFLVHNDDGLSAVLFYLLAYVFMNLGAFAVIVLFGDAENGDLKLQQCCGLAETHLPAALAMTLFMVSLAGIPLTAGFFAKFYLFRAALAAAETSGVNLTALVIAALLCSVISVYYYLRPVVFMFMREGNPQQAKAAPSFGLNLATLFCAAGVLGLGLWSHELWGFAHGSLRTM